MFATPLPTRLPEAVLRIARSVRGAGGRTVVVGGWVRDQLLDLPCEDIDVEVYGLGGEALQRTLGQHGEVLRFGKCFEIFRIRGLAADFSLPRGCAGPDGQREAAGVCTFAEAARWRDLTVNALGLDPCTGEVIDPHGGLRDLEQRVLRAADAGTFALDPLRVLRVARLAARLDFAVAPSLGALCASVCLDDVPAERILEELRKLLLWPARPSVGFEVLGRVGQMRVFAPLDALAGVPQDPRWHPEGDAWSHTLLVVDEAARSRCGCPADFPLMLAALCHDVGKVSTTTVEQGRIRSVGHDKAGAAMAGRLLRRLTASNDLTAKVCALVRHHSAPTLLVRQQATDSAYRRLARKLGAVGVTMELLARLARADRAGRGTCSTCASSPARATDVVFLERAGILAIDTTPPADVVKGRHLIARGLQPGPHFGRILAECRNYQDGTGCADPDAILDRVLQDDEDAARR